MSIRLTRPTTADLCALAEAGAGDALTYAPVGLSAMPVAPPGYRLDRWSRSLGNDALTFGRAAEAIREWRVHEGAGLIVHADGPPAKNSVVAMAAPLPLGYIDVVCRVIDVIDQPGRFGFSYGTLPVHPEQGEESFTVCRHGDGTVVFEIVAVSRPRHILARAVPPVARRLQSAATNRYLDAMQRAVKS